MQIQGVVDVLTKDRVSGWAYVVGNPHEHLTITVQVEGRHLAAAVADQFRPDLKNASIGGGDHGFSIKLDTNITEHDFDNVVIVGSMRDGTCKKIFIPNGSRQYNLSSKEQMDPRLKKLLKYGTTYADSVVLRPPVGYPADLIDDQILSQHFHWTQASNEEMHDRIRKDTIPIPHDLNREGYAPGADLSYWLSGYRDYRKLQDLAAKYDIRGGRYFDFGGSTGRVFRQFAIQTDAWDVWSCDFKISSVEFNLKYFPSKVRVFLNTSFPSLPLPDQYFDLISAYSVFTHINETETGWLLELRRTLRVGGIACFSIHNNDTWPTRNKTMRDTFEKFRPDIANEPTLPEGKTVVTFREDDPYNCHAFHSDTHIRQNWGRFFEICEIQPLFCGNQAMVVCRRFD
jgi:ubiquinone/menaquinone biosynthesis C-methylase UbiE